jgi:very-short-patch-repair endonuclease
MKRGESQRNKVEQARRLRQEQTIAERTLWQTLRNRSHMGGKFRRQHPLGRYIVDFYCHEANLVIELDGSGHDEDHQREYDSLRDKDIASRGIKVLRFSNHDVTHNLAAVLSEIDRYLMRP